MAAFLRPVLVHFSLLLLISLTKGDDQNHCDLPGCLCDFEDDIGIIYCKGANFGQVKQLKVPEGVVSVRSTSLLQLGLFRKYCIFGTTRKQLM